MNMKPELFGGVIADVLDNDVLDLMLDETLPGLIYPRADWGDLGKSKITFDAMSDYCSYQNLTVSSCSVVHSFIDPGRVDKYKGTSR